MMEEEDLKVVSPEGPSGEGGEGGHRDLLRRESKPHTTSIKAIWMGPQILFCLGGGGKVFRPKSDWWDPRPKKEAQKQKSESLSEKKGGCSEHNVLGEEGGNRKTQNVGPQRMRKSGEKKP